MCIFAQPVLSVNNTQIFARESARGTQFLAYQMNYESQDRNAMILPIPVRQPAQDGSLRFIDLHEYPGFFDDLDEGFPYSPSTFSIGCSAPVGVEAASTLEVFEVGNYIASFVPILSAFSRLDERFRLPEGTWSQIPQYKDYGFAVFQLAAGALKPHPMAFEFETARDSLFFPTVHIHDGEVHATEDFDHLLYLQHAGFDSRVHGYQNADVPDRSTGLVRSEQAAKHFCKVDRSNGLVEPDLLVHRKQIRGTYPNRDIEIATFGDPINPSPNLRPFLPYLPWLVLSVLVAWFLRRRVKVKKLATDRGADSQRVAATE